MVNSNKKLSPQVEDSHHRSRILLVEPDRLTRWSVHEYLKKHFTITLAEHTDLALQLIADHAFDAIIVANDLLADGANRIEQLARDQNNQLLVVRTTTTHVAVKQSEQHTVYLEKPFDLSMLVQVLGERAGTDKVAKE